MNKSRILEAMRGGCAPELLHFACVLNIDLGGGDPPPPDKNIGEAAKEAAAVAKEALDFNKQVYKDGKPRQEAMDRLTQRVVDQQLAVGDQNQAQAQDQWNRFKTLFAPVEEQMVKDATSIDTPEAQERAAGQAGAEVEKSYAAAEKQQQRNLTSMGVNPNSGRAISASGTTGLMKAADQSSAMNNARNIVRDKGIALRAGAANFGRNMPNTAAGAYGMTLNSGNNATGNQGRAMDAANNSVSQMNQGFGTAIQGNTAAGQILNSQYSTQVGAWNAKQQADATAAAGFGGLVGKLGAAAIIASSKELKEKTGNVDDADILKKLKDIPVDSWRYKKGVADEGEHVGAYAEDVQKRFGDKAAPGGKVIDMISMHGIQISALKELAKQSDNLASHVAKLEGKVAKIASQGIPRRATA